MAVQSTELDLGGEATTDRSNPPALSDKGLGGFFRRHYIFRDVELVIPAAGLIFLILLCFAGPLILHVPGPNAGNIADALKPPFSKGALLGTDALGNDMWSRVLYGGRISLEVGFGAQAIGLAIGSMIGIFAGYRGGFVGSVIMRIMDMLLALPGLVLVIVVATFLGASELHVIWAISFFSIPSMARLSRAQTLRLRDRDFVTASKLAGSHTFRIVTRHMVPNVYPQLLTFVCLGIGTAVLVEAALSFLGFGVPPPAPTLGNMISAGEANFSDPWLIIIPGVFLLLLILCVNMLADAIRSRISSQ
jgi:peptide/nickel transport system permease protein